MPRKLRLVGLRPHLSSQISLLILFILIPETALGSACPAGFPPTSQCEVCKADADCGRQGLCKQDAAIDPFAQELGMSCNVTSPAAAVIMPGVYTSCSVLGRTCTVQLSMYEDMVLCRLSGCSLTANTSAGFCTASVCGCNPGPCRQSVVQSTFKNPLRRFDWSCGQGSECRLSFSGLSIGSLVSTCSIGQCVASASPNYPVVVLEELMKFKNSFTNGAKALAEWSASDGNFCSWSSIDCLDNVVTGVVVNQADLEGTIPPGLWELPSSVEVLSLMDNSINGTLPADMGSRSSLQQIYLSLNLLSGTIPPNLQLPPQLDTIWIDTSLLSGSIPANLSLPDSLRAFWLDYNQLTGSLNAQWRLPPGLQELSLAQNLLNGTIPGNWSLPSALEILYVYSNRLSGTIPATWQLPPSLRRLRLDGNALTGTIPQGWVLPSSLQFVNLSGNNLEGPLPPWDDLPQTEVTLFPGNQGLCGQLPRNSIFVDSFGVLLEDGDLPPCPEKWLEQTSGVQEGDIPEGGSSTEALFGGVVGGVLGLLVLVAALVWLTLRARRLRLVALAGKMEEVHKGDLKEGHISSAGGGAQQQMIVAQSPQPSPWQAVDLDQWLGGGGLLLQNGDSTALASSFQATGSDHGTTSSAVNFGGLADLERLSNSRVNLIGHSPLAADQELGVVIRDARDIDTMDSPSSNHKAIMKTWTIRFQDLKLERRIGEGSYGRVYLAKWQETQVALKVLLNTGLNAIDDEGMLSSMTLSNPLLENLQKEAGLMAALRHPNVVSFLGVCAVPPCMVTEYCANGSLARVLRSAHRSPEIAERLHWLQRVNMMLDTARGMFYLHSLKAPIIHRDLKSPNLLVDEHWRVKVSDFNLSRILGDTAVLSSTNATNPRWQAPEVLQGQPATLLSDVYSYGVVMWEMLTWEVPFASENQWQIMRYVAEGGRLSVPPLQQLPGMETAQFTGLQAYIQLMNNCWAQVPEDRPTWVRIINELREISATHTPGQA